MISLTNIHRVSQILRAALVFFSRSVVGLVVVVKLRVKLKWLLWRYCTTTKMLVYLTCSLQRPGHARRALPAVSLNESPGVRGAVAGAGVGAGAGAGAETETGRYR